MVIFFEWHWTSMEPKSGSGLPMSGEEAGLEALASPLAGYLGKVQERAASLEYCPWCTSKGLTYALRSYRVNLQESITLCTNPQCLFPLVSHPLEDVLASLVPVEPTVGSKRKTLVALENEDFVKPLNKRLRTEGHDEEQQPIPDTAVDPPECAVVNTATNGQHEANGTDREQVNGQLEEVEEEPLTDALSDEASVRDSPQSERHVVEKEPESSSSTNGSGLATDDAGQVENPPEVLNGHCGQDSTPITDEDNHSAATDEQQVEQESPAADIALKEPDELVPVPGQLFWSNSDNLCWLDSVLVALVKCKSLRTCRPADEPTQPAVWQLMRTYEEVCASMLTHQQTGKDGIVMVPYHVLQKADADLQSLRMSAFKLLQPKLRCKLGQMRTPVYTLSVLLAMDSWVEPLFQSNFHWDFKCSACGAASTEWLKETVPSFPSVLPEWHPLNAVHSVPCRVCRKRCQRRTMVFESLPPVFGLNFVQGLPDKDIDLFAFDLNNKHYSVTTVIQYQQKLKHFVTWIRQPDGSWLEYDDFKHPDCETHNNLPVPAKEIRVVFWELGENKKPRGCSPSSTSPESPPSQKETCPSADDPAPGDDTLLAPQDDDIVDAFSLSEDAGSSAMDTTVTADAEPPIGSTTLLDAFEGLSHDDIITFTLVELKADAALQPENNNGPTEDLSVPSRTETPDSAPDSSNAVAGSAVEEIPNAATSETEDNLSSDPTFEPPTKRVRNRGSGNGRAKAAARPETGRKRAAKSKKTDPPAACSEPEKETSDTPSSPVEETAPPAEMPQQESPESSTDPSSVSTPQTGRTPLPVAHQTCCQSFLESKHPLMQFYRMNRKSTATPAPAASPVTQEKSKAPVQSTPKRLPVPAALPTKPLLRMDESDSLPPKAAEMYNGFGAKTPGLMPPPTPVISSKSPPGFTEVSPLKKRSSSSKVPPGLSDVEALRYRLMKKLKAKKKKLAKLNHLLGQGGASLQPDSTYLCSPSTVTSSTYDGSVSDDFLSDLLSPATTASNLSPDSTDFLEMIANRQDGGGQMPQNNMCTNGSNTVDFLDDFLSQAVSQKPTEMETEALSALDLFV